MRKNFERVAGTVGVMLVFGATAVLGVGSASGASVPFSDPSAKGSISFCDPQGHAVTHGDIGATPFIWTAISTYAPPADYLGAGQNAEINIYQARKDVDPGDWSGDQLTAASYFADSKVPATQSTIKDPSLATVISDFPPQWDGLYQIRMYFGKENYGLYSENYPATTIQVTGQSWSVVAGGNLPCSSAGRVISNEVLQGVAPSTPPSSSAPHAGAQSAGAKTSAVAGTNNGGGAANGSGGGSAYGSSRPGSAAASRAAADGRKTGSGAGLIVSLAGLAAVIVGGAGLFWWRRRVGRSARIGSDGHPVNQV